MKSTVVSPLWLLQQEVINSGLCMGCGTCVAVCPEDCLYIDEIEPKYKGGCIYCGACYNSCPGRHLPMEELENMAFGQTRSDEHDALGVYNSLFSGHAIDPDTRKRGTAGGVVTALLISLLEEGSITGAVAVTFDEVKPWKPIPVICRTKDEILKAAKSKYSFTPQVAVLREAKAQDRLAFVSLPCQAEGLRKAELAGNAFDSVKVTIGICCAMNARLSGTVNLIERELGLNLDEVESISYRARDYPGGFAVVTKGHKSTRSIESQKQSSSHFLPVGYLSNLYAFRLYRCITCYDWSAELADISVGDAYVSDKSRQKFSCVITRNRLGLDIVKQSISSGYLHLETVKGIPMQENKGLLYKKQGNRVFIREARRHGLPSPSYPVKP